MVKKAAAKGKKAANSKLDAEDNEEKQNDENVEAHITSPKKENKTAIQNNSKNETNQTSLTNQSTNEKIDIVKESILLKLFISISNNQAGYVVMDITESRILFLVKIDFSIG